MIVDSVVSAVRALFATAMTVVVMDTLIRFGDLIADAVWVQARPNTRQVLDGLVAGVLGGDGWGATFLGPLGGAARDDRDGRHHDLAVHALDAAVPGGGRSRRWCGRPRCSR